MKKKLLIILTVVILAISILIVLMTNSFSLALIGKGYSARNVLLLAEGFSTNGNKYQAVQTTTKEQSPTLVYLEKGSFGNWKVLTDSVVADGSAEIGWIKNAGMRRFNYDDDPLFEFEWHILRYGNNALKAINLKDVPMPFNTAVNVQQAGEAYILHFITFGEPASSAISDVYEAMVSQGFISAL